MSLFSMFFFISSTSRTFCTSRRSDRLSYLPLAVGIVISAGVGSRLVTRVGFKPVLIGGLLLIAGGLLWFSQVPAPGGCFQCRCAGPSCSPPSLGFSFLSVTIGAVTRTKPREAACLGLINTSQQVRVRARAAILARSPTADSGAAFIVACPFRRSHERVRPVPFSSARLIVGAMPRLS